MLTLTSKLSHNNSKYGYGKFWVAKITGTDPKWGLKREFVQKDTEYDNSSKTTWYHFTAYLTESGIYEFREENNYKTMHYFFELTDSGEEVKLTKEEVLERLEVAK